MQYPKDPLGIAIWDGIAYGFGNFRDIGERTIVRTPAVAKQTNQATNAFREGLPSWVESRPLMDFQLSATDTVVSVQDGLGMRVYRALQRCGACGRVIPISRDRVRTPW